MIAEILVAHLVGDYLLQSHWMATEKINRWWPAIVHGITYTIPYLLVTRSLWALLIIAGTHVIIDHYRLAKHVSWVKNLLGPWKRLYVLDWKDGTEPEVYTDRYRNIDAMALRPFHRNMTVAPPWAKGFWVPPLEWAEAKENAGYAKDTPAWLSTWLMIITDNTIHILIGIAAIGLL